MAVGITLFPWFFDNALPFRSKGLDPFMRAAINLESISRKLRYEPHKVSKCSGSILETSRISTILLLRGNTCCCLILGIEEKQILV